MIKMTRLRLINWHNFCDDIIEFKNITYLLGVNAVGKTTIMDAIRYCLTTNKDFNTAGNKKSGRTLLGSVHQKQRAEDSYLRPGHTVSYIGIEFLDESKNDKFVIIARVESETPKQTLRGVYQDWYITKLGYSLEDVPFFTETKEGKRPTSKEQFKIENRGMDKASNQADARRKICRILGIGEADSPMGRKFNEVFHMGTSLEDIKDIREFIYTYILPEPKVNIEELQKDMKELEKLQEILHETKNRAELLAQINEKIIESQEKLEKVKVNELLVTYAKYQGNIEERYENETKIQEHISKIENLKYKLEELEDKEKEAQKQSIKATIDRNNNEENKKITILEEENRENKKEYKKAVEDAKTFEEVKRELFRLKKELKKEGFLCEWSNEIVEKESSIVEDKVDEIKKAKTIVEKHKNGIKDTNNQTIINIDKMEKCCRELENKVKVLSKGKMCYPNEAVFVRNSINDEFKRHGISGEAKLLCELLYIENNIWQDTLESYLNTQRFNIIVAPKNYQSAKKVFVELGDRVKGIGLIDTRKLPVENGDRLKEEYLSDMVSSENEYAKRYVDFVLKDVICCYDSNKLENYKKSVTKDRLRFQNYCLQRMPKKEHYIGIDAIEKQLKRAKDELIKVQEELTNERAKEKHFDYMYNCCNEFIIRDKFGILERNCDSKIKSEMLKNRINDIDAKINDFKKNPIILRLFDYVEECEKKCKNIRNEITEIKAERKNHEREIEKSNNKLEELLRELNIVKQAFEQDIKKHAELKSKVLDKYQEERKSKYAQAIVNNFSNRIIQDNNALNDYINMQLIPLQQQYVTTYTLDYPLGLEGANKFQREFNELSNIELERHTNNYEKAQERCKERFRKEVLFRLKDDILKAKDQIRNINRVMNNLEYGEESYHFSIEKSKDKELAIFYDIIIDKDNQQIEQEYGLMKYIADMNKSEVFEHQVEDFMKKIMIDVENHTRDNLTGNKSDAKSMSLYVDYRTYLDYDIIVKNSVTQLETPLSKVSGEGSGGENQAPFYVAICSSLLQIYQQNDNSCIKLVLLDEAFNNMTSDRIKPMMSMFKKLNLQLVLIATPEKAGTIEPYCDITYSIVKSGNRNSIDSFERI